MVQESAFSGAGSGGILSISGPYQLQGKRNALVTTSIVLAFVSRFDVLQAPSKTSKRFYWFKTIVTDEDVQMLIDEGLDASILYICTEDRAQSLLELSASAFLLVVSRTGEVPAWAVQNRNRIVLIKSNDRLIYISAILQNLFTSMLVWEGALDRIVSAHGTLAELLEEGARALGCFMAVTDAGFNNIAHTASVEPPTNAFAQLIGTGCYTPDMISHIERDVLPRYRNARTPILDERRHDGEPDLIHFPIYFSGEYFFHLVMACCEGLDPRAACDLLAVFAERFNALCATFWEDIIMVNSPWHRVLTNLIDGVPMNDSYLSTQLSLTAIPQSHQLCLLCFDLSADDTPTIRSHITEAAAALNGGSCYPFAYNGRLLVLCYATSEIGMSFSLKEFAHDIENHIPLSGRLRIGISKTFTNIEYIRTAFNQALIAINFSECIDAECILLGKKREHYCYSFDSILPYYLLVVSTHDNELVSESIKPSILEVLAEEDRASGTEIIRLLWTYLCLERNATAASKQLHMHRNTVLYHIEKIERRFSIELDDLIMRTSLLTEFRIYFLTDGFAHGIDYERYAVIRLHQERQLL